MFISSAWAQSVEATPQGGGLSSLSFMLIVFVVFYFVLIRPQQKKLKQHEAALKGIVRGTKVIISGIEGTVTKIIDEDKVEVEIAPGMKVVVVRGYISAVVIPERGNK